MANLPETTLETVFNLQKQLFQILNQASATDYCLLEKYGETQETLAEVEELQNIKEKARDSYIRLSRLLLTIGEAQPTFSQNTLDLLYKSIQQTDATIAALKASTQEIKKNWKIL